MAQKHCHFPRYLSGGRGGTPGRESATEAGGRRAAGDRATDAKRKTNAIVLQDGFDKTTGGVTPAPPGAHVEAAGSQNDSQTLGFSTVFRPAGRTAGTIGNPGFSDTFGKARQFRGQPLSRWYGKPPLVLVTVRTASLPIVKVTALKPL